MKQGNNPGRTTRLRSFRRVRVVAGLVAFARIRAIRPAGQAGQENNTNGAPKRRQNIHSRRRLLPAGALAARRVESAGSRPASHGEGIQVHAVGGGCRRCDKDRRLEAAEKQHSPVRGPQRWPAGRQSLYANNGFKAAKAWKTTNGRRFSRELVLIGPSTVEMTR